MGDMLLALMRADGKMMIGCDLTPLSTPPASITCFQLYQPEGRRREPGTRRRLPPQSWRRRLA